MKHGYLHTWNFGDEESKTEDNDASSVATRIFGEGKKERVSSNCLNSVQILFNLEKPLPVPVPAAEEKKEGEVEAEEKEVIPPVTITPIETKPEEWVLALANGERDYSYKIKSRPK